MKDISYEQTQIIKILLDDRGYPLWELSELLNKKPSNVHRTLRQLKKLKIIHNIEKRPTTRPESNGEYPESPYYLEQNLQALDIMLSLIIDRGNPTDTAFRLLDIAHSNYIERMKAIHGDEVDKRLDMMKKSFELIKRNFSDNFRDPWKKSKSKSNGVGAPTQQSCGVCKAPPHEDGIR